MVWALVVPPALALPVPGPLLALLLQHPNRAPARSLSQALPHHQSPNHPLPQSLIPAPATAKGRHTISAVAVTGAVWANAHVRAAVPTSNANPPRARGNVEAWVTSHYVDVVFIYIYIYILFL